MKKGGMRLEKRFDYRSASETDLSRIWQKNIENNPGNLNWVRWRDEFIGYNREGCARSFVVCADDEPVGEGTLVFDETCKATGGRSLLADGKRVGYINALRIEKMYEGQGHISRMMHLIEDCARERGFEQLTIGVEARETRNLGIYLHWGYTRFVMSEMEEGVLVLYYAKKLK